MRSELQRHKKSDKVKWALTGILLFILCLTVAGLGLQLFGKGKLKPSEWVHPNGENEGSVAAEAGTLYYNIDIGYIDESNTPPDDSKELGVKQSTTRDMEFHYDSEARTSWGYTGNTGGVSWQNDGYNEWSMREGTDGKLTYVMTGFVPHETLTIKTGGHLAGSWDERTYDVKCNGVVVGSVSLPSSDERIYRVFTCNADENGVLTVVFNQKSGGNPYVGYIKVYAGRLEDRSGAESEASAFSVTPSAASYSEVSTYAASEAVTPPCEHLLNTISYSHYTLHLTASNSSVSVFVCQDRAISGRNNSLSCKIHFGQYTLSRQFGPSSFDNYTVGIWCIHDFRSNCIQEYGHFYSNFGYDINSCASDMSAWQSKNVTPITTESYDSATDILRIQVTGSYVSFNGDSTLLPLYCHSTPGDYFRFYADRTKCLPPDPMKEGYTFTGWYTDEACTNRCEDELITDDLTLYAGWQINTYTLTLNANGGEISEATVSGEYYTVSQIPTPTRTGYTFTGWKTSDGQDYDVSSPLTQNLTLTAQWEINRYKVTFIVDGEVYETITVEYGTAFTSAAEGINLNLMSVFSESGAMTYNEKGEMVVAEDCTVEAQKMRGTDKAINIMKQKKWQIIGGVAGGIALIAIIAAVCSGVKRKRKRRR